jgi:hypothetical protein
MAHPDRATVTGSPGATGGSPGRRTRRWWWISASGAAIAAAAVAALTLRPSRPPAPAPTASTVEFELAQAAAHYEKAIKGLEQLTAGDKGELDPAVAATLAHNLEVIDQAIAESRAALEAQPASEPAQASLIESFKAKIAFLEDTLALINEARKGNGAEAAKIASRLKNEKR